MLRKDLGAMLYVISTRRPNNVARIQSICGDATWIVSPGEEMDYKINGAKRVLSANGLCEARNLALMDANLFNEICFQISDDLMRIAIVKNPEKKITGKKYSDIKNRIDKTCSFSKAAKEMISQLKDSKFKLCGASTTYNFMNLFGMKMVQNNQFIIGDFFAVKPSKIRFDTKLKLKEDYDFTIQHWKAFGGVLRLNYIMPLFKHYDNQGGAVDVRSDNLEQEQIKYLMKKHKQLIKTNPKRKNEILLKLK